MPKREIPRDDWREFFDAFSREHEGWIVNVDSVGENVGDELEVNGKPLKGISADVKAVREHIAVTVGTGPADEVTHIIYDPERVRFSETGDGGSAGFEIEAADGEQAIVQLRGADRSETADRTAERARSAGVGTPPDEDTEH
jgi:hypothetical protein